MSTQFDIPENVEPTNRLRYLLIRADKTTEHHDGGIATKDQLPTPRDGKFLNGVRTKVLGHLYTPHLGYTWTVVLEEHA